MADVVLKSPAKVNVGLRVLRRRPDGYHDIQTVFQELALYDKVTLTKQKEGWSLTADAEGVPLDQTNSCVTAYLALKKQFSDLGGVSIHLEKMIPPGAGLGGGSGNAAAVLKGMNTLYDLSLENPELEAIGKIVGADVPFFVRGGTQLGSGIGDILTPVPYPVKGIYLLVIPPLSISTAWAYQSLKNHLESFKQRPNFARFLREDYFPDSIFENDFERIVIPAYPEIGAIKECLLKYGAKFASLSGSGSTVFGIFDDETLARRAESDISSHGRTILTVPANL